jgi:hypothetical protein
MTYWVEEGGLYLKDAAVLAGLGCVGRNNILVTPDWGPRIRLRAVLLDAELAPTGRIEFDPCRGCDERCRSACPRGPSTGRSSRQRTPGSTLFRGVTGPSADRGASCRWARTSTTPVSRSTTNSCRSRMQTGRRRKGRPQTRRRRTEARAAKGSSSGAGAASSPVRRGLEIDQDRSRLVALGDQKSAALVSRVADAPRLKCALGSSSNERDEGVRDALADYSMTSSPLLWRRGEKIGVQAVMDRADQTAQVGRG